MNTSHPLDAVPRSYTSIFVSMVFRVVTTSKPRASSAAFSFRCSDQTIALS